ncbi:solute carrier family 13 member 4 isoform X2 [Gallus gallus]|uniref:solute carrier family 13 member 4 isoform X2 n=1 Tax=Gallus gallus TaxID=9031 RepID=UPI0003506695|nr:solute carrier family 13 member 4 isoform X2 [Gallus gallus]XP_040514245.1 solute carrier family 13 member 4 isoform X2 [Gallus gallus]|eukprot:XP_025011839.1 solute carrier family 13 member 4 isoform X2 [Gallus gallus]
MAMVKEILRSRNLLLVVLIPLLLLPLPLLYPCSEASCAYVLIVTAVYWVSEAVPLGAAALIPAFLYPLFGVMKSSEVAAEYFKNTTLLLMGVICVAASVEKWNLHKRIALRMVMMAGAKPGMLLLCFMCCTTVLSMWLSNTSTTAMVMPIVEAVLQELVNAEEEHDVISTTGNTIIEENESIGLNEKHDQPSLELIFINEDATTTDFSSLMHSKTMNSVHMIANPIGTMKSRSNGQHLPQAQILVLPPKPSELDLSTKYQYQSRHDHMICKCLSLSISYAATIGGLTTIIGTSTSLIFLEHFNNQYPNAEVVNFGTWFLFSFPISLIMLALTWLWMHWLFLGCNFKETCSVSKKKKTKREEMSERRIHEEYKKLGNVSYPEMVTGFFFILMTLLWFTREPGFVPGWSSFFEKKGYRTDATVSVFLGFLLFLIPAKKPCFGKKGKGDAERSTDANTLDPIITWKDFQKTMPWEIVVLVGGGYALAAGCKTSGLSTWIGRQMLSLSSLPYWAVTLLACILVSLVTEFVSNPATITIFLPILCSMVKAGLGVNLIGLAVVMVAINTWGIRLFQLNTFPEWAAVSNVTIQT